MKSSTYLVATGFIATTSAISTVVPRQLGSTADCRYWPSWINTRDVDLTGTLMFVVEGAEDEAINGLQLQEFNVPWAGQTLPLLAVDLRASRSFIRTPVRCKDGIARLGIQAQDTLRISRDKNNARILVNAPEDKITLVPELYKHIIGGIEQDGVYIGWGNQTTWGFRYEEALCGADGTSTRDHYEVKLLGMPDSEDNTAGSPSRFKGFVKVVVS
ncbi:hypothetical protein SVAN01_09499 [Stagonosporopsis vannaccii]|nr:hypothetical protein SVAN01_09499 [Stagonosporopsis vannaccii]